MSTISEFRSGDVKSRIVGINVSVESLFWGFVCFLIGFGLRCDSGLYNEGSFCINPQLRCVLYTISCFVDFCV